jgi:hypothetical protein
MTSSVEFGEVRSLVAVVVAVVAVAVAVVVGKVLAPAVADLTGCQCYKTLYLRC